MATGAVNVDVADNSVTPSSAESWSRAYGATSGNWTHEAPGLAGMLGDPKTMIIVAVVALIAFKLYKKKGA